MNNSASDERLIAKLFALPAAERAAAWQRLCSENPGLRERFPDLGHLLAAPGGTPAATPTTPAQQASTQSELPPVRPEEEIGMSIGRYKLLEKVGEGGFGAVYVAEQREPVKRRVALKIIKLGMDTRQVVARFEAERQALALMDHPNIAKVLDAGATETGRPYFVMELVRGIKITDYCDQNSLPTAERLHLFVSICHAIQHAHQKGIIHRDLKPSNLLVTLHDGVPVPKVIDFGIAKATQGDLTDKTVYTQLHQCIGTPAYMSPEQAEMSGLDVDTRSDIYSLGVLLYELLTGGTPFDKDELAKAGWDEIRRAIRETEPLRPSTRLSKLPPAGATELARRRGVDVPRLIALLRGDLDWIVMKCLEKDRTRRYETANGLALDITRHLRHEPVSARPPSFAYKAKKFVRRNRLAVAAAAAVTLALVFGIVGSTWQAIRATQAEREQARLRSNETVLREREAALRREAEAHELAARQKAYASDMNLVQQALAVDNLGRAQGLLNRHRPQPGQRDLRGWEWRYLWQFCQSDAQSVLGQKDFSISSLAVSPDGKWVAVGEDENGGLSLWNVETKEEIKVPAGDGRVRVAFSPREALLAIAMTTTSASGVAQFSVRLWNLTTKRMVRELPLAADGCYPFFSNDGQTLATSATGLKNEICLWRVADGTKLASHSAPTPNDPMWNAFGVTRDMKIAAHAAPDAKVRVLDLVTGRELWTAKAGDENVLAVAFSPDGKILATGAGFVEPIIRLWDVASGQEIGRLEGHRVYSAQLLFLPDGKTLASASADQTIRLWDVASRRLLQTLRGHKLEVWRLALLPDNTTLLSGSKDGAVLVWDTTKTRARGAYVTLPKRVFGWRFAADSKSVLTVDPDGKIERWQGDALQETDAVMEIGKIGSSYFVVVAPDCALVAVGSDKGLVKVWDWERRVLVREFKATDRRVYPVRFLARGKRLLLAYGTNLGQGSLHEWDLATGKETRSWPGPPNSTDFSCGVSPDERWCLMLGWEGTHSLIELVTGKVTNPPLNLRQPDFFSFSLEGKLIAAPSQSGFARIWDATTFREVATVSGFMLGVHSAVFSPDGHRLATGSNGIEAVKLWDVDSRENLLTLEGRGSGLHRAAFSPDGSTLGAKNWDGVLQFWRAPSWAEIAAAEKNEKKGSSSP